MENKYLEMHERFREVCGQHNIMILPEQYQLREGYDRVELYATAGDLKKLCDTCTAELPDDKYKVEFKKTKKGNVCNIYRTDMFATTIFRLMKTKPDTHGPQIMIRELPTGAPAPGPGLQHSRPGAPLSTPAATQSPDAPDLQAGFTGYTLAGPSYQPEDFIEEAKKRGYLSDERIARYKEHRAWKKENRTEIEKQYREYQEVLLGLSDHR